MNIENAKLIHYDMVVVFSDLRFGQVLNELAKKIYPNHPSPLITEIPKQLLSIIYPDKNIQCQFANKRLQISDKRGAVPGEDPFSMIAVGAIEAATYPEKKEKIIAYGYNYLVQLKQKNPTDYIKDHFFSANFTQIESKVFTGTIQNLGFNTIISVPKINGIVTFTLTSQDQNSDIITSQINFHYSNGNPPTTLDDINHQVTSQYDDFLKALREL